MAAIKQKMGFKMVARPNSNIGYWIVAAAISVLLAAFVGVNIYTALSVLNSVFRGPQIPAQNFSSFDLADATVILSPAPTPSPSILPSSLPSPLPLLSPSILPTISPLASSNPGLTPAVSPTPGLPDSENSTGR